MIAVEELRKTYAGFPAVVGSSFEVDRGEIFGVVGPNGAGKTTTLKMLAGLIEPTSGEATVAGYDAGDPEMRHRLGFLPEESPLYEDMTPLSYLRFFADLYDVPRDVANARIGDALDRLELEHRERRLGDMSKGMKRKVAITRALVNDPDLLIFDEPASGLDPLTTNYVLEFTRELSDAGKTVVFSAHNLYHVESVCDRIIIMNRGEIVARGTLAEIRAEHGTTEYHVYTTVAVDGADRVRGDADAETDAGPRADAGATRRSNSVADGAPGARSHSSDTSHPPTAAGTDRAERFVRVVENMDAVEAVRAAVERRGGSVLDIRSREPSLEDIFLDVAGEPPVGRDDGRAVGERRAAPGRRNGGTAR